MHANQAPTTNRLYSCQFASIHGCKTARSYHQPPMYANTRESTTSPLTAFIRVNSRPFVVAKQLASKINRQCTLIHANQRPATNRLYSCQFASIRGCNTARSYHQPPMYANTRESTTSPLTAFIRVNSRPFVVLSSN